MRKPLTIATFLLALTATTAVADGPKVSRLPGVPGQTPAGAPPGRPAGADRLNLTISRGHAPAIAAATSTLARALRTDAVTPRILRELAIMRTALFVKSDYEINQHIPMIKACGYNAAKIEAVKNWRASSLFDEREKALLAFVDQMLAGDVDDPTFETFSKHFTAREIVEIAITVSTYVATGLYANAIKLEIEKDGRQAFLGKC